MIFQKTRDSIGSERWGDMASQYLDVRGDSCATRVAGSAEAVRLRALGIAGD